MAYLARNIWVRKWLKRRPSIRGAMSHFEDLGLLGFWSICERLSPERASRFGAAVLAALGPRSSKQEKLIDNLTVAFPDWSDAERERVALGIWRSMGACAGEYPHLGAFGVRAEAQGIGIVTDIPPHLEANFRGERPTVFATGHLANWEVLAAAPRLWNVDLAVVYAPIGDGAADKRLRGYREQMGSRLLPRDGSAKVLLRHLRSGRPIGIVADHRVDEGEELPFFGKTKATTLSPARLALKTGADLVAVRVERLAPARFRISAAGPLLPPAVVTDETEQVRAMMTEFNAHLEQWIRERPEDWMCGKRSFTKEEFRPFRRRRKGRPPIELEAADAGEQRASSPTSQVDRATSC